MNYFVLIADEQKGPYDLDQLKWMWRSGQLTTDTLYWREGMGRWIPLGVTLADALKNDEHKQRQTELREEAEVVAEEMENGNVPAEYPKWVIYSLVAVVAVIVAYVAYEMLTITVFADHYYQLPHLVLGELPSLWILVPSLAIYFLPTLLAGNSRYVVVIGIMNLLFGWTVVVWLAALMVALMTSNKTRLN